MGRFESSAQENNMPAPKPANFNALSHARDDEDAFVKELAAYWAQLGPNATHSTAELAEHYRRLGRTRIPDRTIPARSPRENA